MFDLEHGIALHSVHGKWASSRSKGEVSWFFWSCGENLGYNRMLRQGWSFKARVCSVTSGLLSSYQGHIRNLNKACQGNTDASRDDAGDRGYLSSCTVYWDSYQFSRRVRHRHLLKH